MARSKSSPEHMTWSSTSDEPNEPSLKPRQESKFGLGPRVDRKQKLFRGVGSKLGEGTRHLTFNLSTLEGTEPMSSSDVSLHSSDIWVSDPVACEGSPRRSKSQVSPLSKLRMQLSTAEDDTTPEPAILGGLSRKTGKNATTMTVQQVILARIEERERQATLMPETLTMDEADAKNEPEAKDNHEAEQVRHDQRALEERPTVELLQVSDELIKESTMNLKGRFMDIGLNDVDSDEDRDERAMALSKGTSIRIEQGSFGSRAGGN